MAYGFNLRPAPFGVPAVSPWPVGFQPVPPAPIAPRPEEDPLMGGGAPGGVPAAGGPMFPGLAARFPRLAQAGQQARGFLENFEERRPRLANFARNNSDLLSNLGMALLTTRPGDNAPVREAFYYGRQSDKERRAAQAQAEQEAEANRIWGQFLGGGEGAAPTGAAGPSAPLPPDIQAFFAERAPGLRVDGMDQTFATSLAQAAADYERETGQRASFTSLARTTEEQAELYRRYQAGEIGLAAPPGQSRHESGSAADIPDGPFLQWMQANAARYGLGFLPGRAGQVDPGHIQMAGAPAGGGQPQARFTPQEQAQLQAMLSNPQTAPIARQIIAERMFTQPEPQDLMTVNAGDTVWDPNSRQAVFTAPEQAGADTGAFQQTRTLLGPDGKPHIFGFNPETNNYDRDQGVAPADAPLVAFNGDEIPTPLLTEAIDATNEAETLGVQVQELLLFRELAGVTATGFTENLTTGVRNALVSLGVITDPNLDAQQVFTALQNQQALRLRNPESGFGLTGNTSDRDITFLRAAVANLSNTPQANQAILTVLLAKQRRAAELAALRADYIFENGTLAGYNEFKSRWIEENSIFTPEEQALLQGLATGAAGATPTATPQTLPPGVTQQQWDVMTPAERALFR